MTDWKKELKIFALIWIVFVLAMVIAFYKEDLFATFFFTAILTYLFLVPAFVLSMHIKSSTRSESILIALIITIGATGILSYLLGLASFHVKYHIYIIPMLLVVVTLLASKKFKNLG